MASTALMYKRIDLKVFFVHERDTLATPALCVVYYARITETQGDFGDKNNERIDFSTQNIGELKLTIQNSSLASYFWGGYDPTLLFTRV